MKKLSVNLDHVATLREARKENFPDPVHAAVLAELGGADGITVHLRHDRRHINERDLKLLRRVIKTELNLEMAATPQMVRIALAVKPDMVTVVPETAGEVTTEGGLDLARQKARVRLVVDKLARAGIRRAVFIEADGPQIDAACDLDLDQVEINTNLYCRRPVQRGRIVSRIEDSARRAVERGLLVHAGHGLDYRNLPPILAIREVTGFSIGFAIIARAVLVGLVPAVQEMKRLIEVY